MPAFAPPCIEGGRWLSEGECLFIISTILSARSESGRGVGAGRGLVALCPLDDPLGAASHRWE